MRELYLSRNLLERFTLNTLAGLQSLVTLTVSRNQLTCLRNRTFLHVPLLQVLDLSRNNISCIENGAFTGISALIYLNLGRNSLFYLPEDVFQNSTNLVYLLLNGNRFPEIKTGIFRNLTRLIQLSLYENSLSSIAEGALEGTGNLFYLQWNYQDYNFTTGNRLMCDCSSEWLYRYIKAKRFFNTIIYCSGPRRLKDREMNSLSLEDFACGELTEETLQIHIEPPGENHVVIRGGCLRLICTSTPYSQTSWRRIGQRSIPALEHSCCSFSSCQPERGEGELVIQDVSESDVGTYICTATLKNVTASTAIHITIGEPPVVRLTPTDQYLAWPGNTAYFRVHVSGKPHPSVEWYHDIPRGIRTQIEEDSRHAISSTGSLVIMDTTISDVGDYRAIISNGAGSVTMTARLEFFFSTPCRQECQNGGTCYETHYCYCQAGFLGRHCEFNDGGIPAVPTPTVITSGSGSGYSGYTDDTESGDDQYNDQESGDDGSGYSEDASGYSEDASGYYEDASGYSDNNSLGYDLGYYNDNSVNSNDEDKGGSVRERREKNEEITNNILNSFPWIIQGQPLEWYQERQKDQSFEYKQPLGKETEIMGKALERVEEPKSNKKNVQEYKKEQQKRESRETEKELDKFLAEEMTWNLRQPFSHEVEEQEREENGGGIHIDERKREDRETKKELDRFSADETTWNLLKPLNDEGQEQEEEVRVVDTEQWIRESEELAINTETFTRTLDKKALYEERKRLLLESGLAVGWNEDHPGSEHENKDYSPPVLMGLKILPSTGAFPQVQTNQIPHNIHED